VRVISAGNAKATATYDYRPGALGGPAVGCVLSLADSPRPIVSGLESLNDGPAGDEPIYDNDNGDDEKQMDEAATHVHDKESENPQDKQNYRDGPKHYGILAKSELRNVELGAVMQ
jgi:hypothetical protein